jgi:hypothetical protein
MDKNTHQRALMMKFSSYSALVVTTMGFCWAVPQIVNQLAWMAGTRGAQCLSTFETVIIPLIGLVCVICVYSIISLKIKLELRVFLSLLFCVIVVARLAQAAASGMMSTAFCEGFAERIRSRVSLSYLTNYSSEMLRTNELEYINLGKVDPASPINKIIPGPHPVALLNRRNGKSGNSFLISWPCVEGIMGIYFAESPLPKVTWIDQAVPLTNGVWVIVRGG